MSDEEDRFLELRREPRWNLNIHLRVFDQEHNYLLGHAVDVATKGMQVMSEEVVATERSYRLALEIVQPDGEWELVPVRALSVWSRQSPTGLYHTGFHIFQVSPQAMEHIQHLLDALQNYQRTAGEEVL